MPNNRYSNPSRLSVRRRIVLIEETEEATAEPTDPINHPHCPYHIEPLPMQAIGESESSSGDVMVVYACSDPDCRYREGWGTKPRSGDVRCLIRGFDQSRR